MNENLKEEIKLDEKEHKAQLLRYNLSKILENFGIRSFWLTYTDPTVDWGFLGKLVFAAVRFAIRMFPVVFLCNIVASIFRAKGNPIIYLILYIAIYLTAALVGHSLRENFELKLNILDRSCREKRENFFSELCEENNITPQIFCDEIYFEDGIKINANGDIVLSAPKQTVSFKLYSKKNYVDLNKYLEKSHDLSKDEQKMDKNIASIEFNDKFGIIIHKSNEHECMKYFSPTLQSQMIKSKVLAECYDIETNYKEITAKTDNKFQRPEQINIFDSKPIIEYFEETENYCTEFSTTAKRLHSDLSNIKF